MGDRVSAFVRTYPLEIAVALLLAAAAGAIVWNALVAPDEPGIPPPSLHAEGPMSRPRCRRCGPCRTRSVFRLFLRLRPRSMTMPSPVPAPVPRSSGPPPRDAIGDLIRSGDLPPLPVGAPRRGAVAPAGTGRHRAPASAYSPAAAGAQHHRRSHPPRRRTADSARPRRQGGAEPTRHLGPAGAGETRLWADEGRWGSRAEHAPSDRALRARPPPDGHRRLHAAHGPGTRGRLGDSRSSSVPPALGFLGRRASAPMRG